jgi:Ni2+-binding GTPase involved in maturation of urease and hydrogenase
MSKPLLPIALVTGFLGSGKTTFMRHLIRDAQTRGIKVGVVINELASPTSTAPFYAKAAPICSALSRAAARAVRRKTK